jgi:CRP-like cAMP-binding protein
MSVGPPADDPFAGAAVLGILDEADRRFLATRCHRRTFAKGQILFLEGDGSDFILVLLSGHLNVLRHSPDGDEFIVNTVRPGETVGEVGVFSRGPRTATVRATEPSVVLKLAGSEIIDLVTRRPDTAVALLGRLSDMVRRMTDVATDLIFLDLRQRVAKFLLERDLMDPLSVHPGFTQSDLAASIGATRQRVNECLRSFVKEGWITMASRQVQVVDRQALARGVRL